MANPAEIAYLSVRDGELSNAVRLVEFRRRKVAVHTFWGGPKLGCSDGLRAGIIESHNLFVLRPILLKLHLLTRPMKSFPMVYGLWRCIEVKLSIPLEAHYKAQSSEFFLFSGKKIKRPVIFYLLANPLQTVYLSVRDQELFKHEQIVQVRQGNVVVHTFLVLAQARLIERP